MRKLILLGLVCLGAASAQSISVGVLGGVPFTDAVSTVNNGTYSSLPTSSNFIVGPTLQVNLPAAFRFEFDALYRPASFQITALTVPSTTTSISANQWQFPFLLQYRFLHTPVVKPFVEAGVSFDHLADVSTAAKTAVSQPGQLLNASNASFILGGGMDVKIPFVRLSGEIRYSHAGSVNFADVSNTNQAEILFGVHF
jgi:hypothetical protein